MLIQINCKLCASELDKNEVHALSQMLFLYSSEKKKIIIRFFSRFFFRIDRPDIYTPECAKRQFRKSDSLHDFFVWKCYEQWCLKCLEDGTKTMTGVAKRWGWCGLVSIMKKNSTPPLFRCHWQLCFLVRTLRSECPLLFAFVLYRFFTAHIQAEIRSHADDSHADDSNICLRNAFRHFNHIGRSAEQYIFFIAC